MLDRRFPTLAFALFTAAHLGGCVGDDAASASSPCYSDTASCIDPSGQHHSFVVSSVELPAHAAAASSLALDLDGDSYQRKDNQLGAILPALNRLMPTSIHELADSLIRRGELIILLDVQATDLMNATAAGSRVYAGRNPVPAACRDAGDTSCGQHLTGNATIDIDTERFTDVAFVGDVSNGEFVSQATHGRLEFFLPEIMPRPLDVDFIGARATTRYVNGTLEGTAGAAVKLTDIHERLYPMATEITAQDCTGTAPACCTPDTLGAALVSFFDTNQDCSVTAEELSSNDLLNAVLTPDLDLLDANGNFAPGRDGVKESISLGAGFTAIPASVSAP